MERSNQQTTDIPSSNKANPMRAGVQNPSGSNYMVAGPTIGGTATPYNPSNIEAAKEHLADSFATKATINDTPSVTDSTLKDTVVSGASTAVHTAADVTKTVVAGAAAAGAATVTAVKNLFADKGTPATTTTGRTGMNPATTTHAAMTTNKAQPIADFPHTQVHNLQPDTNPIIQTHTQAATGPINPVPIQEIVEPIHSTGLDRTSTAASGPKTGYRAKEADLHATSGVPASKVDVHPTTKLNQGYNTHHTSTNSPGAIDARPLTDKAAAPVLGAGAAAGAAAAGTAAYLGNKTSGLGSESKETTRNASSGTPLSTTRNASSGTPLSTTSYATMDSTKGTYNPSVSSSTHSTSHTSPAAATASIQPQAAHATHHITTNTSSAPPTEKIKAPVVGAASAIGAAAAGTAAYHGNKASEAKESVKDTAHNLTSSNKTPAVNNMPVSSNMAPTSNTYSTSTPIDAPLAKPTAYSTTADPATQHAIAEPLIKTTISSINPVTKSEEIKASTVTPVTEPAIVHSPTLDVYQTTTGNKHSSASHVDSPMATNTSSSRPMTEKATAPGIGAAAAVGAAAAGTAAYLGNKDSDAKDTTKDTTHTMSTPSNNHTSTTYNTANTNTYPSAAPSSYTTSNNTTIPGHEKTSTTTTYPSNTTTATAPIMAAGPVPQMTIDTTKSQHQQQHPSATTDEIKTADNIAAAIPTSYHGAVPKVGPGEEVVWVKTVTTTDYYDDGTPTGRADVIDRHQEAIDPRTYSTVQDDQTVYNNADQQRDQQDRGASQHM